MTTSNESKQAVLESLSAMFDDEANEQDLQALLKQDSTELNKQMAIFHLIQSTLHNESEQKVDSHLNLAEQVRDQLSLETQQASAKQVVALVPVKQTASTKRFSSLWTGFAVAASVAFMVVLGGNLILNPEPTSAPTLASDSSKEALNLPIASLDELKKQPMDVDSLRLQNYLRQHAEQATMTVGQGMIPMARIASYPVEE